MIGQNGIPLPGKIQVYVGSQWNDVTPFALTRRDPTDVYLDPGPPPQLGGARRRRAFKARHRRRCSRFAQQLDARRRRRIDISPALVGQQPARHQRRHRLPGEPGHRRSRTRRRSCKRADFARVLAEFWADGPTSETPPGHWNVIANYVSDQPLAR